MSAHGSPTSADGQGDLTGSQIAFRMVQAAEAAVAAANAASTAINSLTSSSTGTGGATGTTKTEWYKVLPKPSCFEPKDREAELATFRDWWWQVEQYMLAVDANYGHDLQTIRSKLDEEISLVEQSIEQTRRSAFLYGLLASLLKNRPLLLLKGIEQGSGLEAVRQLFRTCQPSSRNRSLGLLHLIMQWPSFDMKSAILPQILKLEDSFREYEKIASTLSEELKFAVLLKCLSGHLKTYLQVSMRENMTYEELREATLRYDQCTIKWSQSMALGSSVSASNDTSGPMDVDRGEKGKGKKGKSKSNGKGKDKGKGKQKSKSNEKGFHSGKGYGNQQQQSSWNSKGNPWQNSSWNSGGDNSGKGGKSQKGGKSKDSGKGKDVIDVVDTVILLVIAECVWLDRAIMVQLQQMGSLMEMQRPVQTMRRSTESVLHQKFLRLRHIDSWILTFLAWVICKVFLVFMWTWSQTLFKQQPKQLFQMKFRKFAAVINSLSVRVAMSFMVFRSMFAAWMNFQSVVQVTAVQKRLTCRNFFDLTTWSTSTNGFWDEFQLDLYEVADSNSCHRSFMRLGDVSVLHRFGTLAERYNPWQTHLQKDGISAKSWKPCQTELQRIGTLADGCNSLECQLNVRAVSFCKHVDVILDSGSDVTLTAHGRDWYESSGLSRHLLAWCSGQGNCHQWHQRCEFCIWNVGWRPGHNQGTCFLQWQSWQSFDFIWQVVENWMEHWKLRHVRTSIAFIEMVPKLNLRSGTASIHAMWEARSFRRGAVAAALWCANGGNSKWGALGSPCNRFSLLHGTRRWKWEKWASLLRMRKDFKSYARS